MPTRTVQHKAAAHRLLSHSFTPEEFKILSGFDGFRVEIEKMKSMEDVIWLSALGEKLLDKSRREKVLR
jgi:hypothetical protein